MIQHIFSAQASGPIEIEYRKLIKSNRSNKNHFMVRLNQEEYDYLVEITKKLLVYPIHFLTDVSHNTDA